MATKKTKTNTKKYLEKSVCNKFYSLLLRTISMADKISNDGKYVGEVTRSFKSIEKKLSAIKWGYYWGKMTNYK